MIEILTAAAVFGFSLGFSQEMAKDLRRMIRRHRRPFRMGPPIRLDEGLVQRGNGSGGPTNPKPRMIPRGTRSISYPDPGPDRQPTNPFTGKPVKPQPHGGRIIREGQWDPGWNYLDMSTGCQPRPQDGTPNPPSTDP